MQLGNQGHLKGVPEREQNFHIDLDENSASVEQETEVGSSALFYQFEDCFARGRYTKSKLKKLGELFQNPYNNVEIALLEQTKGHLLHHPVSYSGWTGTHKA